MPSRLLILVCIVFGVSPACENAPGEVLQSDEPSQALQELLTAADRLSGGAEDGPGAIARVVSARIGRDEKLIYVLDQTPPLLKIFDHDGPLVSASVNRGGGPAEFERASNIAVGDEHAVVSGRGRVTIRRLIDGAQYAARSTLPLFDVGFDCGGRLIGYGPDRRARPRFVHVLELDTSLVVVSSVFENERPSMMGWPRSILGTREGSLIVFRSDFKVNLAFLACSGEIEPRHWDWAVPRFPSQTESPLVDEKRDGTRLTRTFRATVPLFRGAADLNGQLLWIETRQAPTVGDPRSMEDYERRTYFYLADASRIRGTYIAGSFALEDVSENAILLGSSDPWPRVLVVRKQELLHTLEQVGIVARK